MAIKNRERKHERMSAVHFEHRGRAINRRRNSLSIGKPTGRFTRMLRKRTSDQAASPLFSKLPTEIREAIFEAVLVETGAVLLASSGPGYSYFDRFSRIVGLVCDRATEDHIDQIPWGLPRGPDASLALLCTCRRIYTEALPILYSRTQFAFRETGDCVAFSQITPKPHLQRIRSLRIDIYCGNAYALYGLPRTIWTELFLKAISSMESLQSLYPVFVLDRSWIWPQESSSCMQLAEEYSEKLVEAVSERCKVHLSVLKENEPVRQLTKKGTKNV